MISMEIKKIKIKEEMIPILHRLFYKIETEETLPLTFLTFFLLTFYEASITLTAKPEKHIKRKENCRHISLMSIDPQIPNKILVFQILGIKKTCITIK